MRSEDTENCENTNSLKSQWTRKTCGTRYTGTTQSSKLNSKPMCESHNPRHRELGYREWMRQAAERHEAGERQKQCQVCKFWFFKEEA